MTSSSQLFQHNHKFIVLFSRHLDFRINLRLLFHNLLLFSEVKQAPGTIPIGLVKPQHLVTEWAHSIRYVGNSTQQFEYNST